MNNASRFLSPLLVTAVLLTGAIALWGLLDTDGLTSASASLVQIQFSSRGWFIMLTVSAILLASIWLSFSQYGLIKLGRDDDVPEFSTFSWLTMLFAAGMGVGLLYWGTAEPLSHFLAISAQQDPRDAASQALFVTIFHWGLHAWAIYAMTGLVIAYFGFRLGCPSLMSAPILKVYGLNPVTRVTSWLCDLLAIVAIAIGLGGSIAMGVYQLQEGIEALLDLPESGVPMALGILIVLVIAYIPPLMTDLGNGMARLSNAAIVIACALMIFVLLAGPTHTLMGGTVQAIGEYLSGFLVQGFRTFSFMDEKVNGWFQSWTLTYMVWWLAWAPFVGVFIARISKGRTIREFLFGVMLGPTAFSIAWFGVFGGIGFDAALNAGAPILDVVRDNASAVTFYVLDHLPLSKVTIAAVTVAAFLFLVTSVVSAAFVLGMFSTNGDINPSVQIKLIWGALLGALGLVMVLADSISAVKQIIALGALPFVFVIPVLIVCLIRALRIETRE